MLDLYSLLEKFGVSVAIIGVLVWALWRYLVLPRMNKITSEHEEAVVILREIRKAMASGDNPRDIISLALLTEEVRDLSDLIDKRCGNMSCPAVKIVDTACVNVLARVEDRLKHSEELVEDAEEGAARYRDEKWSRVETLLTEFRTEARESRKETQAMIGQIFDRVSAFTDSFGVAVLSAVQDRIRSGGINQAP